MDRVTTRAELADARARLGTVAFVPTMGYLHEGHLSLVRHAKRQGGSVVASIFVNPLQFGPSEDLATYPRDLERDLALLADAGCDLVWTPNVTDVYPDGFATHVEPRGVSEVLEGASRPGHFTGVATVLTVLFNLVKPTQAFFGQKDAQQVAVVRQVVRDLCLPVEIVTAPTVREPDGLALSSRNTYLDAETRPAATVLIRSLRAVEQAWSAGTRDGDQLRALMRSVLAAEPVAQVDYVSVAHPDSLAELDEVDPAVGALVSLAVRVGKPRLIDNVVLPPLA